MPVALEWVGILIVYMYKLASSNGNKGTVFHFFTLFTFSLLPCQAFLIHRAYVKLLANG